MTPLMAGVLGEALGVCARMLELRESTAPTVNIRTDKFRTIFLSVIRKVLINLRPANSVSAKRLETSSLIAPAGKPGSMLRFLLLVALRILLRDQRVKLLLLFGVKQCADA